MSEPESSHIVWHQAEVTQTQREALLGQRGCVVWFTGLSGSGKSTVSRRVEQRLLERGLFVYALDGDNVRHGLNRDLGFSPEDRAENIRRISAVAQLFADSGAITLTAFISPYRADRAAARALLPEGRFIEAHVSTDLQTCERRDPKGLYQKARAGEIPQFTGISAPYEAPEAPELVVDTSGPIDASASQVIAFLERQGFIPEAGRSTAT